MVGLDASAPEHAYCWPYAAQTFGRDGEFWKGLVAWMQDKLVGEGMISANDLDLLRIIEEPEAIVEAIFDYYESRGFQPTRAERDKMLNL